ncbi:MAG: pirin family protein [Candidatus Nitrohelix vancouverensis]|uniref:Pirin family protein n=1 Tax=Candidatus Nitrohelix vancouverensis TaxID=2705534 RepID=A0A7T0C0P0_9BACT|nr:MAG: pirin family protein [Candidatus Nitrohelix vancouverensis]
MKEILKIKKPPASHWVGDGFPVRSLFAFDDAEFPISPFLLLDYAGPAEFPPSSTAKGVRLHPHRGFETVTLVYRGEVEHKDTVGNQGKIGPGDVQWMTAGSGLLHEEMHSAEFTKNGGTLQMIQLWVNLPAKDKMTAPQYQEILKAQIPSLPLENGAGSLRVIAGSYQDQPGPAKTFTPVNVWEARLQSGASADIEFPQGFTAMLVVLEGSVQVNDAETLEEAGMAAFDSKGERIRLAAKEESMVLLLSGQALNEPVAHYGPFVMNTRAELLKAIEDYEKGRMGLA